MSRPVILTMDVEPDVALFLDGSYLGVDEALTPYVELLDSVGALGDFFVTADVAQRVPDVIRALHRSGHTVGCHGWDHRFPYYCTRGYRWQVREIRRASDVLAGVLGRPPRMFRAPNFSADGATVRALEATGYAADSSVLPGRKVDRWRLLPLLDFTSAPRSPYFPSYRDVGSPGEGRLVELPLTENPFLPGAPLGVGTLFHLGLERTLEAVRRARGPYVTFLLHPWELVDLGASHPRLPGWVKSGARQDWTGVRRCVEALAALGPFATLSEMPSPLPAQTAPAAS